MSRTFAGAAGNRLVASEIGAAGRPVLLLHGGGQTRHAWGKTARRLAEAGYHCLALDQRGHGDSGWVPDGDYTFSSFAEDVAAVARDITAEWGERPIAVGASLGGLASLLAIGTSSEPLLAGLVLVDITPRLDPKGMAHIQGFMRSHAKEGFSAIAEAADAIASYLPHRPKPASLDGLKKNLRLHPDGRWRWHWDPRFLDGPLSINSDARLVERRATEAAKTLSIPTLLVRGALSEMVSREAADAFLALAPVAESVDVATARHMVAGDRNDVFSQAILDFLERRFAAARPVGAGEG